MGSWSINGHKGVIWRCCDVVRKHIDDVSNAFTLERSLSHFVRWLCGCVMLFGVGFQLLSVTIPLTERDPGLYCSRMNSTWAKAIICGPLFSHCIPNEPCVGQLLLLASLIKTTIVCSHFQRHHLFCTLPENCVYSGCTCNIYPGVTQYPLICCEYDCFCHKIYKYDCHFQEKTKSQHSVEK